jgi:MFS transporter, DHA2 family, methylenomycin A resistance protein
MTDRSWNSVVVLCAAAAFFMITLDTSIVNLALPEIDKEFRVGLTGLQWVVDSYLLVFASLLIGAGALGDMFGAKCVFLTGLTVFTLASGLCFVTPDASTLDAARALQGIGAALQLPTSLTLLNHAVKNPKHRVDAVSLWAGAGPVGLAFGPVAGGLLVQAYGWRSIFAVNLPVGVAIAALAWACVPDSGRAHAQQFDLVGQISLVAIIGCLTFLLIEVPRCGWMPGASACIAALIVAVPVFIAAETSFPSPMLPFTLFRSLRFSSTAAVGMLHNAGIFGQIFVLGLSFQELLSQTPIQAGISFLPLTGALAVGTRVSAKAIAASGASKPLTVGHLLAAVGTLGIASVGFEREGAGLFLSMLMMGLGAGMTTPAMNISILDATPSGRSGVASGVLNTARQVGTVIGVAVLGACLGAPLKETDAHLACFIAAAIFVAAGAISLCSSWSASARSDRRMDY